MNTPETRILESTLKRTNYRWVICSTLFAATTINYLDRQVLSLTWKDFIAPEFHWTNSDYGNITSAFSIIYAISMLFAGKFIDKMGTKKGFIWAISIWSIGACLHAICGLATEWWVDLPNAEALRNVVEKTDLAAKIASISVMFFIFARFILALGESGNFPAAIKTTAEYFPKKDRAYATSIFNTGATVGALVAPLTIPFIAERFGWEMAFIIIGALGFIWIGFWHYLYEKPEHSKYVNNNELEYINQDQDLEKHITINKEGNEKKISIKKALKFKQTWAFAVGKFLTDGVWWFFLFWTPAYFSEVYGLDTTQSAPYIFILYLITMLSIIGGYLPTFFIDKCGMDPYAGRMRAMLIFAFFPLLALLAQPLGSYSIWIPTIIIGIAGAAHQAWSANIFSTIGDMFPKSAIATITGIGGMAGGIGAFIINKGSGVLFDYTIVSETKLFGFKGIESGYFIIFCVCGVAYLGSWIIMKILVPKIKPVIID